MHHSGNNPVRSCVKEDQCDGTVGAGREQVYREFMKMGDISSGSVLLSEIIKRIGIRMLKDNRLTISLFQSFASRL